MYNEQVTIQSFEQILNETPIVKGDKAYFTCPSCHKPKEKNKFSVSIKQTISHCFSCGYSANYFQLKKFLGLNNSISKETYKQKSPATNHKEIKSKYSLEQKEQVLKTLFEITTLNDKDKETFFNKRRFTAPKFYKSYSRLAIKQLEKIYSEDLVKECGLSDKYKKENETYYIFIPDNTHKIVDYLTCSFTDKVYKKVKTKNDYGFKRVPYGLHLINDSTKHLVITEGEEKAEKGHLLGTENTAFLSVGSISNHKDLLNYIKEDPNLFKNIETITILFDRKIEELNTLNEENQSCKLAKSLINLGYNAFIAFMEHIPNAPKESDLVDYLIYIEASGKNQKQALEKILNTKINYRDLEKLITKTKPKKEIFLSKPLIEYKKPEILEPVKYDTVENIRTDITRNLKDIIFSKKSATVLIKAPPATGKTFILKDIANNSGSRIAFLSYTKQLRDSIAKDINGKVYLSLVDRYKELIDKLDIDKNKAEIVLNNIIELIKKGYSKRVNNYLKKTFNIKVDSDKTYFKKVFLSLDTILLTHSLFINHQQTNIDYSKYFDAVALDEDITSLLAGNKNISIGTLTQFVDFVKDSEVKTFLNLTIDFMKTFKKEVDRTLVNFYFKEFLSSKNIDIQAMKRKLSIAKIELDNKKIDKELFRKDNLDINSLPDKFELELLVKEFLNDFQNSIVTKEYNDILGLTIEYKKTIDYGKKTNECLIILDATADTELLKDFGINISHEFQYFIKADNLQTTTDFYRTYKTSNLTEGKSIKDNYLKLFRNLIESNSKVLFFSTKEIEEKLRVEFKDLDCKFGHYYKDDKATNEYKDCETIIITPPKVNLDQVINTGRLRRPNLNNFETQIVPIATGFINIDGTELFNYELRFKDEYLNRILKQKQQVLMVQAISRIRRDFVNNRKVIILGNISLKEYGIVPNEIINYSELEKNQEKSILLNKFRNIFDNSTYLLNNTFNDLLLSNVTSNKNKMTSNLDIDNITHGFNTNETPQTIDTTAFVLNPYNIYINEKQHKCCDIKGSSRILTDLNKKTKSNLVKELSLVKSFILDEENNSRIDFYYQSSLDKKEVIKKIRLDFGIKENIKPEVKTQIIENLKSVGNISEVRIKELVINEPFETIEDIYKNIDVLNDSEKMIFDKVKDVVYKYISDLDINDYIGHDEILGYSKFISDYPYKLQINHIETISKRFNVDGKLKVAMFLFNQYAKDFKYQVNSVNYIEPIPYENKTFDIEPVKELPFELSPDLKELSSFKMEKVKLNIDSYFKVLKYKKLDKFVKNNLWNSAFYEFKSDFYINKINEYLGIFDLEVSKYLFDLFPLKQNQTILTAPIIPIDKGINTNVVNNQMSLF